MAVKYFKSIAEVAAHYGKSDRQIAKHLKAHPELKKKDPKKPGRYRYPRKAWDAFYAAVEEQRSLEASGTVVVTGDDSGGSEGLTAADGAPGEGVAPGDEVVEISVPVEKGRLVRAQRLYRERKIRSIDLDLAVKEGRLLDRDWVEAQFTARAFDLKRSLQMLSRRCAHKVAAKVESKVQEVEEIINIEVDQFLGAYSRPMDLPETD